MKTAACLIVKNEEALIAEWVAHYAICGFDKLLIFDNQSEDQTKEKALSLSSEIDVSVYDWPFRGQKALYEFVCTQFSKTFDWIAFFDADEFLHLPSGSTVKDLVLNNTSAAAIVVPWLIFGSNFHLAPPTDLTLVSYSKRSDLSFAPNRHVKSVVRPDRVKQCINPHFFDVDGLTVLPSGALAQWENHGLLDKFPDEYGVHLRHYFTRSKTHWESRIQRGQFGATRKLADFEIYDRNEIDDPFDELHIMRMKAMLERSK